MDELDLSYGSARRRPSILKVALPVIVLLIVVAAVSGLVFGGVIQGDATRVGPEQVPTTQPTVLITP